jgi:hypothetical protein
MRAIRRAVVDDDDLANTRLREHTFNDARKRVLLIEQRHYDADTARCLRDDRGQAATMNARAEVGKFFP